MSGSCAFNTSCRRPTSRNACVSTRVFIDARAQVGIAAVLQALPSRLP
jgi:Ni,Fe-hydrogenase I small subunit